MTAVACGAKTEPVLRLFSNLELAVGTGGAAGLCSSDDVETGLLTADGAGGFGLAGDVDLPNDCRRTEFEFREDDAVLSDEDRADCEDESVSRRLMAEAAEDDFGSPPLVILSPLSALLANGTEAVLAADNFLGVVGDSLPLVASFAFVVTG
jgi:hypothetical protein